MNGPALLTWSWYIKPRELWLTWSSSYVTECLYQQPIFQVKASSNTFVLVFFFYLQCCRMILAIIHNISEAFLIGFILKLVSINTTFWGFLGSYSTISLLLDHLFAICTATSMLLVTWYACYFDARFIKMKIEMITHINWTGSCLQNLRKQKSIVYMRNVSGIWWNSSVLWSAIGNRYPKTCVVILSNIFDCFFFQHDSLKAVVNWKKSLNK